MLLISMDTLRADHLGCYGYGRNTSPQIDALAAGGVRFSQAASTSSWTTAAHASLFTSRYPSQLGIVKYVDKRSAPRLKTDEHTLAEILSSAGYHTLAFSGGGLLASRLGFDQGFVEYRNGGGIQRHLKRLLKWIDGRDRNKPFFLFLHINNTARPHLPPSSKYARMFRGDHDGDFPLRRACDPQLQPLDRKDLDYVMSQYDGEIAHADAQLGRLLSHLNKADLKQSTLIVFLSGHGEEFFEHGGCDRARTLYQELIWIPLILTGPDIDAGAPVRTPVSIIDVAPTVLDYLGLPVPETMEGQSLLPLMKGATTHRQYHFFETGVRKDRLYLSGIRSGPFKLIFNRTGRPREMYNLKKDPHERSNVLHGADAGVKRELLGVHRAWRRHIRYRKYSSYRRK